MPQRHYFIPNSMRYEFYQLARKYETGFCQLHLEVDPSEALARNSRRGPDSQVPDDVITKMARKLESPNPLQNSWEKFSFSLKFDQVENNFRLARFASKQSSIM
jgi:tRNA uridine 5-carbamoylmethylation protein Kti12